MFLQVTFDAHDPERLAAFWAHALGWSGVVPDGDEPWKAHYRAKLQGEPAFANRIFDPTGQQPPLWFQRVPEEKAGKNRLHLDLYPTGRDDSLPFAERERVIEQVVSDLVARGATLLNRVRSEDPDDLECFDVLQDPEGNEFCVSS